MPIYVAPAVRAGFPGQPDVLPVVPGLAGVRWRWVAQGPRGNVFETDLPLADLVEAAPTAPGWYARARDAAGNLVLDARTYLRRTRKDVSVAVVGTRPSAS